MTSSKAKAANDEQTASSASSQSVGGKRLSSRFLEQVAAVEDALKAANLRAKLEDSAEDEDEGPEKSGPLPWIRAAISAFEAKVASSSEDIWEVDPDTNVVEGSESWDAEAAVPYDNDEIEIVDTEEEESSDEEQEALPVPVGGYEEAPGTPQGTPPEVALSPPGTPEAEQHSFVPGDPHEPGCNPEEPKSASKNNSQEASPVRLRLVAASPMRIPLSGAGEMDSTSNNCASSPMQIPLGPDSTDEGGDATLSQVLDDLLAARSVFEAEGSTEAVAEIDRQVSVATAAARSRGQKVDFQ
jgi:hypothetical protein